MILEPCLGPRVRGIEIPRRLYCVATEPALLAGMSRPRPETLWANLGAAGFRWVVCLESERPAYDPSPLGQLLCIEMEDLEGEQQPRDPAREGALIRRAVETAAGRLTAGEGVIVHCWGGSGRTGAVLGCLLLLLGHPADNIILHLRLMQQARGKPVWPEASWQVQFLRRFEVDRT